VNDALLQETIDAAVGMYPWLDTMRDASVTELEICHGHLNNPGVLPAVVSFRSKVGFVIVTTVGRKVQ
jgi:nephrocystin-3